MAKKTKEKAFVVLTKGNRTLVVQQPTKKQMKRYEKKEWTKSGTVMNGTAEKFCETLKALVKTASGDNGQS